MAESLHIVVFGDAQPAGSKRAFQHPHTKQIVVTDANAKSKPWKQQVAQAAGIAVAPVLHGELIQGAVSLDVTFYEPRPKSHYGTGRNARLVKDSAPLYPAKKPDATKLLRGVEDALTSIVWRDDAQVVDQVVRKRYGAPARCEITVVEHALQRVGDVAADAQGELALAA